MKLSFFIVFSVTLVTLVIAKPLNVKEHFNLMSDSEDVVPDKELQKGFEKCKFITPEFTQNLNEDPDKNLIDSQGRKFEHVIYGPVFANGKFVSCLLRFR